MTKERWGAAKFVMQQLRVWCVNDFDANAEPKDNMAPDTNKSTIAHQEFMDTLAPAWPKDTSKENILAVLKRSSICINTRTHNHTYLYVRPAGDKEVSVQRVRLPADASFLRPAAGERYIQYRHGNKEPHSSFQEHLDWEQAWLTALLEDKPLPPWLPSGMGCSRTPPHSCRQYLCPLYHPSVAKRNRMRHHQMYSSAWFLKPSMSPSTWTPLRLKSH